MDTLIDCYINYNLELFLKLLKKKYGTINYKLPKKYNIKIDNYNLDMEKINWNLLKKNPIEYISNYSQIELEKIIENANYTYYNSNPKISDGIYDIIVDYVKDKYPNSKILKEVGSSVSKNKIKLPVFMPSIEKLKPDTKLLENWLLKYKSSKILSDKLDGMSLLVDTRTLPYKAYTRGDGNIGQDITWILDYINIGIMDGGIARGELIVSKYNWDIIKKQYSNYSNARNFVSGYTGRKQVKESLMKYIDFVVYEWITLPSLKQEEQLNILKSFNINVVNYIIVNNINSKLLSNLLEERRNIGIYEIDGIIITDNNVYEREKNKYPKHSKAFKMVIDDQTAEVIVSGITWEPSMYGVLNPVVNVSSILIDGVKISNVTGNNARFILNNNIGGLIGPGSTIKLTRSGGVIPKILKVIKPYQGDINDCLPDRNKYIDGYEWNHTNVDIVLNNPDINKTVQLKRIEYFFNQLGVSYFKSGMVKRVFDGGFDSILKILNMSKNDLLNIDGVKDTLASKIIDSIKKNYNKSDIIDIMSSCYIFGSGYGKKRIKPIIDKIPNILDLDIQNPETYNYVYETIISIDGYQKTITTKFIKKIEIFKQFYITLPEKDLYTNKITKKSLKSNQYKDRIFCFSGFRPDDILKNKIIDNGGQIENTLTKKITDLIIKDTKSKITSKIKKAIDNGISVIYLENFI